MYIYIYISLVALFENNDVVGTNVASVPANSLGGPARGDDFVPYLKLLPTYGTYNIQTLSILSNKFSAIILTRSHYSFIQARSGGGGWGGAVPQPEIELKSCPLLVLIIFCQNHD